MKAKSRLISPALKGGALRRFSVNSPSLPGLSDLLDDIPSVQALITEAVRESEVLEYKTASSKFDDAARNELAKDVSPMALPRAAPSYAAYPPIQRISR